MTLLVALTDTLSKQWQPLLDLVASLPPDFTTHDEGSAVSRLPHRVKFTSLTSAQRTNVADLYAAGVPVPDICARFNITKNTVIRLRKQAGVPQRQRGLDESQGDGTERCKPPARPSRPSPRASASASARYGGACYGVG